MTRSKRIDAVKELEDRKAEEIARSIAQAKKNLDRQRHQWQRLQEYLVEYTAGLSAPRHAEHMVMFQERRAFLHRLSSAVEQAEQRVQASERDYEALSKKWHQQRGRAQALASASDRLRASAKAEADRAEQKTSDEVGAQKRNGWSR